MNEPRDFDIRSEREADRDQIAALLDAAFEGHDEAELVDRIRQTPEYVNDLTLVAHKSGIILGFIMLSYVSLKSGKDSFQVLSLGPLAVVPHAQKTGIGASLVEHAVTLCEQRSEPLIVLLGHAEYYPRFGFQRASLHSIKAPVNWPDASYMVLPLAKFSPTMKGAIQYPASWHIG
ncbi:MAG: GNAT family N-acetyltransferase [Terriglobales bacterium]